MKKKILGVLLCGVMILGITGCAGGSLEDNRNVKKYIESIGYECDENNLCTLINKEDGSLNTFNLPKDEKETSSSITYEKTWKDNSYFSIKIASYRTGVVAYYQENYNNIRIGFDNLKKGENLTCKYYQDKGDDKFKICNEDISMINEAKLYFEEIIGKSGVELK